MKSRDRVLAACRRERADRLLCHVMGFYEEEAQQAIQAHLGLDVRSIGPDFSMTKPARHRRQCLRRTCLRITSAVASEGGRATRQSSILRN